MFFTPEHSFRKLSSGRMQASRTPLRKDATDVRWVRLTDYHPRRVRIIEGERPCYVNSRLDLLPQPRLAPWRWLPPPLPRSRGAGAAAGAIIITISAPASASASSTADMATMV